MWSRGACKRRFPVGLAILGAALGGLGIIFWIAANWALLSRVGQFGLLQGVIIVMCAGAISRPAARPALSLLALLGIGGLFAYFGQTYQTGADPWQLFALWAALALFGNRGSPFAAPKTFPFQVASSIRQGRSIARAV